MALQSSGAISLANIQTEFGGSNPISMNEYYRGGGLVPSSVTAVPASGTIDMADFYGTSNVSPMSTTNYARINSSSDTTFITRTVTSAIVFNSVSMNFRLRRQDNYVYYEVQNTASANSSTWWNASGTSQGSMGTNYVTMGRFNLGGITAIKMNWAITSSPSGSSASIIGNTSLTGATYSASDNSFQSVSNGQSIGARLNVLASAECYQQSTSTGVVTMDVTAQKSGYSDTTLGTYRHEVRSVAISNNCF
jgi:hypothetical protein